MAQFFASDESFISSSFAHAPYAEAHVINAAASGIHMLLLNPRIEILPRFTIRNRLLSPTRACPSDPCGGEVFPAACHDLSQMSRGHRYCPPHLAYERLSPLPMTVTPFEAGNVERLCHWDAVGKKKPVRIFCSAAE